MDLETYRTNARLMMAAEGDNHYPDSWMNLCVNLAIEHVYSELRARSREDVTNQWKIDITNTSNFEDSENGIRMSLPTDYAGVRSLKFVGTGATVSDKIALVGDGEYQRVEAGETARNVADENFVAIIRGDTDTGQKLLWVAPKPYNGYLKMVYFVEPPNLSADSSETILDIKFDKLIIAKTAEFALQRSGDWQRMEVAAAVAANMEKNFYSDLSGSKSGNPARN